MNKSLPENIPRVNISSMIRGPSRFLNRKQNLDGRKVSTLEAVMFALEAVGESELVLGGLNNALRTTVNAVGRQGGKNFAI